MGKKPRDPRPSGFDQPTSAIRSALSSIDKRLKELEALDPTTLTRRDDPNFKTVEERVNQTLANIFGADSDEYQRFTVLFDSAPFSIDREMPVTRDRWVRGYQDGIAQAIAHLRSVKQLFEEGLAESSAQEVAAQPDQSSATGRKVFIVHGHDGEAKHEAARFLEKLKLEPVILHEQPNQGRTIIEKLEKHAPEARFAIVLLTPDDVGHPAKQPDSAKPRARQNVMLELGLFLGSLGRPNVVALVKGDVELPSDFHGVIYVPMDPGGAWKVLVAREIKQAGIDVDLNLAFA